MVVEAVTRLLPGVLGDERSACEDSFAEPDQLDYPHFTRPRVCRGREVPSVLLSGDHKRIEDWRKEQARLRTQARWPDLAGPAAGVPTECRPPAECRRPTECPRRPARRRRGRDPLRTPHPEDEPAGSHAPCT